MAGQGYDPVRGPAAAAKLYVLAALDEAETALRVAQAAIDATRRKYIADLSGDRPFAMLIAVERYERAIRPPGGAGK